MELHVAYGVITPFGSSFRFLPAVVGSSFFFWKPQRVKALKKYFHRQGVTKPFGFWFIVLEEHIYVQRKYPLLKQLIL